MTFLVSQNGVLHGDSRLTDSHHWPNATVPYTFGSGISGEEEEQIYIPSLHATKSCSYNRNNVFLNSLC